MYVLGARNAPPKKCAFTHTLRNGGITHRIIQTEVETKEEGPDGVSPYLYHSSPL